MNKRTPGLLIALAVYLKMNPRNSGLTDLRQNAGYTIDQFTISDEEANNVIEEMMTISEESRPECDADFYRLASMYFLYRDAFLKNAKEEYESECRER